MTPRGRFIFAPAAKAFMKRRNAGLQSTRQILSSAAPSESEATFRIHFPFVSNDLQKPTCDSPASEVGLYRRAQSLKRLPFVPFPAFNEWLKVPPSRPLRRGLVD